MKFLCVCDGGNVRSQALAYVLHDERGYEAIAVGRLRVSAETLRMMCGWADAIVIMQPHMEESIPKEFKPKLKCADVGVDRYGIWIHPELLPMVRSAADWLVGANSEATPFKVSDRKSQVSHSRLAELAKVHRVHGDDWTGVEDRTEGLIELCRDWITPEMVMTEIGSFAGVSTEIFALHAKMVYAVDPFQPYYVMDANVIEDAERRFDQMSKRCPNVFKFRATSLEAAKAPGWKTRLFDAVYIDGDHDGKAFAADIEAWLPKLKSGGLLMGHDWHMVHGLINGAGFNVARVYSEMSWVVQL